MAYSFMATLPTTMAWASSPRTLVGMALRSRANARATFRLIPDRGPIAPTTVAIALAIWPIALVIPGPWSRICWSHLLKPWFRLSPAPKAANLAVIFSRPPVTPLLAGMNPFSTPTTPTITLRTVLRKVRSMPEPLTATLAPNSRNTFPAFPVPRVVRKLEISRDTLRTMGLSLGSRVSRNWMPRVKIGMVLLARDLDQASESFFSLESAREVSWVALGMPSSCFLYSWWAAAAFLAAELDVDSAEL